MKEDTPRDTIRARAPASPAEQMLPPLQRNGDHCPFFVYFFFFSFASSSSAAPLLAFVLFLAFVFVARRGFAKFGFIFIPRHGGYSPKHLGSGRWNILLRVIKATLIDKFVSLGEKLRFESDGRINGSYIVVSRAYRFRCRGTASSICLVTSSILPDTRPLTLRPPYDRTKR